MLVLDTQAKRRETEEEIEFNKIIIRIETVCKQSQRINPVKIL